ncbi:MAG: proprotein convertase P-domain-containing protein, partial [Bacteroidales bacterium]|nr:proprotein convertase P-domain-containing protein [Bacteroidales bacterium]
MKRKILLFLTMFYFLANACFADQYDYNPVNSPGPSAYDSDTYTELGWTTISVSETDVLTSVVIDYTYSTSWASEGSFHLKSPIGTYVEIASGESSGTYNHTLTNFNGEAMNGNWILWIEDSWGDGGNQATDITISFHYVAAGAPSIPSNPNPAVAATGVATSGNLTWDFGADTDTYDLWFGEAGSMTEVVTGGTAGAT